MGSLKNGGFLISPRTRLRPGELAEHVEAARQAIEERALDRFDLDMCTPTPDRLLPQFEVLGAPVERS